MNMDNLVYVIPAGQYGKEGVLALLEQHPEIKFVSLVGVDLAGNDTDEKIPISVFFEDYDNFFNGTAVQTDGSSVVLPGIATLSNARVDIKADANVNWFVDYNDGNVDPISGKPIGTLRIPSFLRHATGYIDSRSILRHSVDYVADEVLKLIRKYGVKGLTVNPDDIERLVFTTATELEFWVKSPSQDVASRLLSTSQKLQEQYWQRTHGVVRTALEQTVERLQQYGLEPEMGHKEVGGIKAQIDDSGKLIFVLEQLEVDWKFANDPVQTADNEIQARIIVREVFRENGLEVTFQAKPIHGVAGSGEHTHVGMGAIMKDGKFINLFNPDDMKTEFLSSLGYGAIMGILKHYEVINPFVSSTTDSLNRLKPGFEAPVCIVTALGGETPDVPTRNRSVLAGLIRNAVTPKATRFEMRSPNPFTNTYTAIALFYLAALDGIRYALTQGKTPAALLAELSKKVGDDADYLEKDRAYRSEVDVFENFTEEERNTMFGKAPATVWENFKALQSYPEKLNDLVCDAFERRVMESFKEASLIRWALELQHRIIPDNLETVISYQSLHMENNTNPLEEARWVTINQLRTELGRDTEKDLSIFSRIKKALVAKDYDTASALMIVMSDKMDKLADLYYEYSHNAF
ncbi:glutamine synthetase catalytic domain protein [Megasphaera vaginalis (ex Srinivasan et al. 2021)]|uniref:glutamine synthetase n=1 Tax=Megasphaera vaginalis (ex Srinivasan et al. 2021) TaxID=1111454 RepID=U7UTD6_9FIRM|nr:glutamine synthetase catalytic domain protein [Megasphaera vaginalis (ex Srinivasan et al. 2021)]ERT61713.1 glutamine synthetase catalytic domain protein [Megasphaera vaginalis (ex Srinivasan et al. 2021)]